MDVYNKTRRCVGFLIAAKSMKRKAILDSCRAVRPVRYRVHRNFTASKSLLLVLLIMQHRVRERFIFLPTTHVPCNRVGRGYKVLLGIHT